MVLLLYVEGEGGGSYLLLFMDLSHSRLEITSMAPFNLIYSLKTLSLNEATLVAKALTCELGGSHAEVME